MPTISTISSINGSNHLRSAALRVLPILTHTTERASAAMATMVREVLVLGDDDGVAVQCVLPDDAIGRVGRTDLGDVFSQMPALV